MASKTIPRRKKSTPELPPVRLTNPQRVLYADLGITKRGLAEYYAQVAKWMLPHIAGRPLAIVRCPDGMTGKCFFQKHPPQGLSDALERVEIQEKDERATYVVVHDLEGLVGLVQFGALELHIWGSKADDVERPDRLVFDLDPDPAVPWKRVVVAAFLVRDVLEALGLRSFVKTTGGKGLHVVVPIQRKYPWPEVKAFCKSVAEFIERAAPGHYVTNMSKAARRGKIFVDYLRNERGSTSIAAYSTRARAGATVSVPIDWKELKTLPGPAGFNVLSVPQRLARRKRDPWAELPKVRQSITQSAIRRLRIP